jgi:hypothetical protein
MSNLATMPLGKKSARRDPRTLRLSNYTTKLLDAPNACDLTGTMSSIGMMANDVLGDCTCATVGHMIQQWTAENGEQYIPSDSTIVDLYSKITGYTPGKPDTDNGAIVMDVLNYWRKNSVEGHSIEAYAYLNTKDIKDAKDSVFYFGNAYLGVSLPISAQDQEIWDVPCLGARGKGAKGSWGGHAIPAVAYDPNYIYVITWGKIKKMTWDFYTTYCDEAYALLSTSWVLTRGAPNGFQLAQLSDDLQAIQG